MTLFLFQSASAIMTHMLDSPGRAQASNLLYSLPSWGFREMQEKGGGGYALGLGPLQEPGLFNFHFLLLSSLVLVGEWLKTSSDHSVCGLWK